MHTWRVHVSADTLLDALRSQGLRITAPRRAICEVLADGHAGHLTAAGIVAGARKRSAAKIDQSTVYRTLEVLEEAGVLNHSHLGHGASVYHLSDEADHQHLVCASCDSTTMIRQSELAAMLTDITERTGFVPDPTHFAVSGLCADCAASAAS